MTRIWRHSPSHPISKHPADLTRQVHDMRELLDLHQRVNLDSRGLTDPVDIVSCEIDKHDMLCSIFHRAREFSGESSVLCVERTLSATK